MTWKLHWTQLCCGMVLFPFRDIDDQGNLTALYVVGCERSPREDFNSIFSDQDLMFELGRSSTRL